MNFAPSASGPNGFVWLFSHEILLLWRGSILVRTRRHVLVPVIGVGIVFQAIGLAIAWAAGRQHFSQPILILIANLNIIFLFFLMLSRAMTAAIDVLYARGDVDFLLASPIPPYRVLAVRMIGVAAAVAAPWALLGGVLANGLAIFGHFQALAAYPVVAGIAALATALAFTFTVILVTKAGARRARLLANLLALVIGVAIFTLGQAPRFIPPQYLMRLWHGLMPGTANAGSALWWPGRAMLGQPIPLLVFIAVSLAGFCAVLSLLGKSFASGAISAAAHTHRGAAAARKGNFRGTAFAATVAKNLLLLLRFPGLATQTVYRSLTLVPVAMILTGRIAIGAGPGVVVPLIVFLAGQLSLFFVSVIIGSEQAPDLLRSAPVPAVLGRRAARMAAGYLTIAVMALPVLGFLLRDGSELPVLLAFMAGAAFSNLALGEKLPIPLLRPEFGKARTGTILGLILGVAVSSGWSFAAWLLVTPRPFGFLGQ